MAGREPTSEMTSRALPNPFDMAEEPSNFIETS
jgi:hypothetical protein